MNKLLGALGNMVFADRMKEWCNTINGPYRRPFAPNTEWSNASVFVVGTNPATPMRDEFDSFDQYWSGLTVDPRLYNLRYSAAHSGKASKSTKNARHLLDELTAQNVLVTNVVWYPVSRKRNIPRDEWTFGRQWLNELIDFVCPRAVFCHGADAEDFGRSLNPDLDRYRPPSEQNEPNDEGMLVQAYHHFSGQGLKKGAKFQPERDLPIFASAICRHAGT